MPPINDSSTDPDPDPVPAETPELRELASSSATDSGDTASSMTSEVGESNVGDVNAGDDEGNTELMVVDVAGKSLHYDLADKSNVTGGGRGGGDDADNDDSALRELYVYRNTFNLVPKSVGWIGKRLKTLKFFGNEVNLFPAEAEEGLASLETLQVKEPASFPVLELSNLKRLKELELSKSPPRITSALTILNQISALNSLQKLSLCQFNIRSLPPEIGSLSNLNHLDLSFNKIKKLPAEITCLVALVSLILANNKLSEIPSGFSSSLHKLETLDLSNNRLTSLGSLQLTVMQSLKCLNLQYNKLNVSSCEIPSWVCCNLEGNPKEDGLGDIDVSKASSASFLTATFSSKRRCSAASRLTKRWKRRCNLRQKAIQERLCDSRKRKVEISSELQNSGESQNCKRSNVENALYEEVTSDTRDVKGDVESEGENLVVSVDDDKIPSKKCFGRVESSSSGNDESLAPILNQACEEDECSSKIVQVTCKSKRHYDEDLDSPKPTKHHRLMEDRTRISRQYSELSFCGIDDHLPDGFYDAGRGRPFLPLRNYEEVLHLDSREVILLDREEDEALDAIAISAKAMVARLKRLNSLAEEQNEVPAGNLQVVSWLALFVSDHLGGGDRTDMLERTRKAVAGSNYKKPFVCTCSAGNNENIGKPAREILEGGGDIDFSALCDKSLSSIKARRSSIVVPLGTLQFGVCRHRALLMKYLCDRMEPPIPCELVRGYLDFMPHAWNVIVIRRGDSLVRMVVDACHPHDIREETDSEYMCRYMPLSHIKVPLSVESIKGAGCSFPSFSTCDENEKAAPKSLVRCKFGSVEAAVKVSSLDLHGKSVDDIKGFEYKCMGEIRILGALQHPCIVEMYGHQILYKGMPSEEGKPEHRILQSAIFMEYVQGGSLKRYLEKISKDGQKHVPARLALVIARDVASAIAELHSKHIIHRDIKSENILIDLDGKRNEGMPVIKLCDFDIAVPLRSPLHTCCIAHRGTPPPDVCVGTPSWMAPEVLRAFEQPNRYGLEVDIWSYGCLLLELLTLKTPYTGLSTSEIWELVEMGKRPPLTEELEALGSLSSADLEEPKGESEALRFLVDLYHQCTEKHPTDRPTAVDIHELLVARTSTFSSDLTI